MTDFSPYPHLGAFESTKIHGTTEDVLSTTHHLTRWAHDLYLLHDAGIQQLRYSVPWHRIERRPGEFDWSWMDGPMHFLQQHRMQPMLDPLHHTSFPSWLTSGFANEHFPALYERFIQQIAERYEWVENYTVFNEPLPTTLFCSYTGMWYPHGRSDREFVTMVMQVGRAICRASAALRAQKSDVKLVHVDTAERHQALDCRSAPWVSYTNERRFLMLDLILGRMDRHHPLYPYLAQHGFRQEDEQWFLDHCAEIDVLGLDYYVHSEIDWYWNEDVKRNDIRFPCTAPHGFASVAREYVSRYKFPIMLSETNLRGTIYDRLTWLKFMEHECELLVSSGLDFRGFCWYPSIDSTDWNSCCTRCTKSVDPQGIWWLDDRRWHRHGSELSMAYSALAQGRITSKDLPAYPFQPPLDRDLRNFVKLMDRKGICVGLDDEAEQLA